QERDAMVERVVNRGDTLALVGGTVHAGHAHAAERDRKHGRAVRAELAGLNVIWRHRVLTVLRSHDPAPVPAAALVALMIWAGRLAYNTAFPVLLSSPATQVFCTQSEQTSVRDPKSFFATFAHFAFDVVFSWY